MDALTILTFGFICLACFLMGAKVAQMFQHDEKIETPTINPMKLYREKEAKREAQREQDRIETIMRNIEGYDGTDRGQEDVPR